MATLAELVGLTPQKTTAPDLRTYLRERANFHGVDPRLAESVFRQESSSGRNTATSTAGARGPMQLLPATFRQMMPEGGEIDDPFANIEAGIRYLAHGKKLLGTDDPKLLAAGYYQGFNRDSLKRGEIVDTNPDPRHPSVPQYAEQVAGRVRGNTMADLVGLDRSRNFLAPRMQGQGGKEAPKETPQSRNAFALVNDSMVNIANAMTGLAKAGVDAIAPGSALSQSLAEFMERGRSQQSDWQKAQDRSLQEQLAAAGSEWEKPLIYVRHALTEDPLKLISEGLGNIVPFAMLGRTLQAARVAEPVAQKIVMGVAGLMGMGEVRGNIYDKIQEIPDADLLAKSPEYAEMRQSLGEKEAKHAFGSRFVEHLPELAVTALVSSLGGKYGLEGLAAKVGPKGVGRLGAAGIGFLDEGSQGLVEQGATNIGVRRADPNQPLTEDLALNFAQEGLLGGVGGLAAGGRPPEEENAIPPGSIAPPGPGNATAPGSIAPPGPGNATAPGSIAPAGGGNAIPPGSIAPPEEPSKPSEGGFEGFEGAPGGAFPKIPSGEAPEDVVGLSEVPEIEPPPQPPQWEDDGTRFMVVPIDEALWEQYIKPMTLSGAQSWEEYRKRYPAITHMRLQSKDGKEWKPSKAPFTADEATLMRTVPQDALVKNISGQESPKMFSDPVPAEAPAQAAEGPEQTVAPSLGQELIAQDADIYRRLFPGIDADVERMAADRKTAVQIASSLAEKYDSALQRVNKANPQSDPLRLIDVVRTIRTALGVPSLQAGEDAADFEVWLKSYNEKRAGQSGAATSSEPGSQVSPVSEVSSGETPESVTDEAPAEPATNLPAPARQLFVTFGGKKYPVDSPEDAQAKWIAFRDQSGAGVSGVGNGVEVKDQDGNTVAKISYNGRLWGPDGKLVAEAPDPVVPPEPERLEAPAPEAIDDAAHQAATSPENDLPQPTGAQQEAGNYQKGHIKLHGLDISIENPKGSVRSGTDEDGKAWETTMAHHYGYIRRTEGADGDHVDVFLGDSPDSETVFVVDQVNPKTGEFDEHKVMLGFASEKEARAAYLANYQKGWKGLGAISAMPLERFKEWVREGRNTLGAVSPEVKEAEAKPEPPKAPEKPAEDFGAMFDDVLAEELAKDEEKPAAADKKTPPPAPISKNSDGTLTYNINVGGKPVSVTGRMVDIGGGGKPFRFAVHQTQDADGNAVPDSWTVSELYTGLKLGEGESEAAAIRGARDRIEPMPESKIVASIMSRTPMNPQFRPSQKVLDEHLGTYRGIPIGKPAADLTDEEVRTIAEPSPTVVDKRNIDLGMHQSDPRFFMLVPGRKDGAVQTDFMAIRDFFRGGRLSEQGKRVQRAGDALRVLGFEAVDETALMRTAYSVLQAIDSGKFNDVLRPDNEFSRKLFTKLTGIKLPRGLGETKQLFKGTPFTELAAEAEKPAKERKAGQAPKKAPATGGKKGREWTEIGKNAIGQTLYEDDNGVRSYIENGVRLTESVLIIPGRGIAIDKSKRGSYFSLAGENEKETDRTAGQAAASAAKNTAAGLNAAIDGLGALFGGQGKISMGPVFDEDTYAKAAPLFKQAIANFGEAGKDLREMMRAIIRMVLDKFGPDAMNAMKPYAVRFMEDVRDGKLSAQPEGGPQDEQGSVQGESPEALGEVEAEGGGAAAGGGDAGGNAAGGGGQGTRDGNGPDAGGLPAPRGGRGGASGSRAPRSGKGGRNGAVGKGRKRADGTRVPEEDAVENASPPNIPAANFRITEDVRLGQGGEAEKFRDNLAAIQTLKQLERERRRPTPEEQKILARYVGWGGLSNAFDDGKGNFKDGWEKRGRDLAELLSPAELKSARRSTRNAHYTSKTVVDAMWSMAQRLGFRGGMVLESSAGTGNFLGLVPDAVAGNAHFVATEIDSVTARIATALYPQETVLHTGFNTLPLPDNEFDLNIGNPPFGEESIRFQYNPGVAGRSIHNQFVLAGMDAVRPGGLQVIVVSRYMMDTVDSSSRAALARKARLVAAIRLPDTAFVENARTEVVTDILVFQKLTKDEQREMDAAFLAQHTKPSKDHAKEQERQRLAALVPHWIGTVEIPDPLGGEAMRVNSYFGRNPEMVMGTLERSGSMRHKEDVTVRLDKGADLGALLAQAVERLPEDILAQEPDAIARSAERFRTMSDALRISVAGQEAGSVAVEDGKLVQVVERETPSGEYELAKRELLPESPWSPNLYMDQKGRWYSLEVKTDEKGKPVKVEKDGKATNLNVYTRKVYETEADVPSSMRLGDSAYTRLRAMAGLRDALKRQLVLESQEGARASDMERNRKEMAAAYDAFVKEHGFVNDPRNARLVTDMPDGALVLALETKYQPEITAARAKTLGQPARPAMAERAPILSQRVVVPYAPPDKAGSPADALVISLSETGRVDMPRIAQLLGVDEEQAAEQISAGESPLVFYNPETRIWETRDAYLSGEVRRKLNAAMAAGMPANIKALEAVQPEPWGAENVSAIVGSVWIPETVYEEFIEHLTGARGKVRFAPGTNTFSVEVPHTTRSVEWGTQDATLRTLLEKRLNSESVRITREDADGKTFTDHEATAVAEAKSKEIERAFQDWIFEDSVRRDRLVTLFNDKFNTRVLRQFDGSHLTLPGKVPDEIIRLRRHQTNAVWRGISQRFMLLDHVVGAGKTFTAIARAMERRRMGLSRKPMMVVPNHLVEQFAADVYRLYPGAKVLAASKKDFEKSRRRRLFAKIATGEWDIVVVPHSSFKFMGIAPETEERFLEEELRIAEAAIEDAWEQAEEDGFEKGGFRKPFNVKQAELLAEKLEARMAKLKAGSQDRLLSFEQLGVDDLTVDEAHEFKNLFYSSRLTGVRGMGNKLGSQKAFDLYNKVRVLRESPTGTVTFMTGTPISNSAVEMYLMMRYLAAGELRDLGLEHFDAWRAQFVDTSSKWEFSENSSLKQVTRLGRTWSNMRSLMDLYYSFTDAVSIDDIKRWYKEDTGAEFPVPKVKGGGRQSVVVKPTPAQVEVLNEIIAGFAGLPSIADWKVRGAERLRLMDRARKLSLDVRVVNRYHTSKEKGGKLDRVSDEVDRIYKQWNGDKGTQLVFLDRSVPLGKGDDARLKEYDKLVAERDRALAENDEEAFRAVAERLDGYDANEMEEIRGAMAGGWNAYAQIKENLVARGIPANEIRFIQEANTDAQKQAIFDAVNGGQVRVLLGSTPRLGAGTNVQQRLVALHHVDVGWKPSDIEQREGRIIRQGNGLLAKHGEDFEVEILAYATERTIDAKMWDLNATKLKTINAIRNYTGEFTMDFLDEETVSMAEIAALASGDPLLLERVKLESEIEQLELLERGHRRKVLSARSSRESAERWIADGPRQIEEREAAAAAVSAVVNPVIQAAAKRSLEIDGVTHNSAFSAAGAAKDLIEKQRGGNEHARWKLMVGGTEITNKANLETAIAEAFGDQDPFEASLGGTKFVRRNAAAARLSDMATSALRGDSENKENIGTFMGLSLFMQKGKTWAGEPQILLDAITPDGTRAGAKTIQPANDGNEISVAAARSAINDLGSFIQGEMNPGYAWIREQIENAKRDLPAYRKRETEPFGEAGELAAKRKRLQEVLDALSGKDVNKAVEQAVRDGWAYIALSAEQLANATRFSRAPSSGPYTLAADVEAAIEPVRKAGKGLPPVVVAQSVRELPKDLQQLIREDGSVVRGAYLNGTIYLIGDNLGTPAESVFVLLHEAAHFGLREVFGRELDPVLMKIHEDNAKVREEVARLREAHPSLSLVQATEEVLADMAGRDERPSWVQRIVAWIRDWFRRRGIQLKMNDSDVLAIIAQARGFWQRDSKWSHLYSAPRFSSPAPVYYSQLAGMVASKGSTATPTEWKQRLAAWINGGQVKRDEVEWSGVREWLDLQQGKVTAEQVGAFLRENGVRVEETALGNLASLEDRLNAKLAPLGFSVDRDMDGESFAILDADGEPVEYDDIPPEVQQIIDEEPGSDDSGRVKFAGWQLPGGTNYREVLLRLPGQRSDPSAALAALGYGVQLDDAGEIFTVTRRADGAVFYNPEDAEEGSLSFNDLPAEARAAANGRASEDRTMFRSNHWDQPNVLAHFRVSDRTDAEGRRVLFVQEIQSDWGQKGRKEGFLNRAAFSKEDARRLKEIQESSVRTPEIAAEWVELTNRRDESYGFRGGSIPPAPFVTKTDAWVALALKRIVRMAAEEGYDAVAWATGEQNAETFSLSNHIDRIYYEKAKDGRYELIAFKAGSSDDSPNSEAFHEDQITLSRIEELVGKEIAQKIADGVGDQFGGNFGGWRALKNVDLKVGGDGMKTFYDQIVPNVAKEVLKKVGGGAVTQIDMGTITTGGQSRYIYVDGRRRPNPKFETKLVQPGFLITPSMREKAMGGFPLFSRAPSGTGEFEDRTGLKYVATPKQLAAAYKRWQAGEITDEQMLERVRAEMEKREERRAAMPAGRVRGADWIEERLVRARRTGELSAELVDVALWMVRGAPHLANNLGISIREGNDAAVGGQYEFVSKIATLFSGSSNPDTAVHEILHHTERMMPAEVQEGIRQEWLKQLRVAVRRAKEKLGDDPEHLSPPLDWMLQAAEGGYYDMTLLHWKMSARDQIPYEFSTPSEYWAVNASRIMRERYEAGSWVAKARQWLNELIQKVRNAFGMRSNAAILRGLEAVLRGDGTFVSRTMIVHTSHGQSNDMTVFEQRPNTVPPPESQFAAGYREQATKVLDRMRMEVDPFAFLPSKKELLSMRYRLLGRIAGFDEIARDIKTIFSTASEEDQQAAYHYFLNPDGDPASIPSPSVAAMAQRAKRLIEGVGDMLVERGLLSEEAREAHRGRYLPQVYLKFLLGDSNWKALGAGKKVSQQGYLKGRRLERRIDPADGEVHVYDAATGERVDQEFLDAVLGPVRDPGYLSSLAIVRPLRDMAILDYLEAISGNEAWVLPKSVIKWRGKRVSPWWAKTEADRLRKQSRHQESPDAENARQLADELDALADEALGALAGEHREYRQIPNTARYGRLRGILVRREIYEDLVGVNDFLPQDPGWAMSLLGYGGIGTNITQLWKAGKVSLNPPAQVRNFVSNMVLLQLSGVPLHRIPSLLLRAARQIMLYNKHRKDAQRLTPEQRAAVKHYLVALKYGVTESTFAAQEVYRMERDLLEIERRQGALKAWGKVKLFAAATMDWASDKYQFMEALGKTMKIMDEMERKGTPEADAALEAQEALFDYSLVSSNVRYLRNAPLGMPFLTFAVKVAPQLLKVARHHPQRFIPWVALAYGLPALVASMLDVDDDDLEKLKKALPEWLQDRGHAYILPVKDGAGRWQVLDLGYFFPWTAWTEPVRTALQGEPGKSVQALGMFSGPVSDLIVAMMTGRDSFTGREIVQAGDPPQRQYLQMMNYLWSMAMPPIVTDYGAAGHAIRALEGSTNRFGDPLSTGAQAALRAVGVNIHAIHPETSRMQEVRRRMREIQDTATRLKQRLQDRGLSEQERVDLVLEYRDEMRRRHAKLAEYMAESDIDPKLRTVRDEEAVAP